MDAGLRKFISENTSGIYSWPVTSSDSSSTSVLRDRLTGLPLDDKGRYTRQVIIEGKVYSPKYFPCATSECQARGYSLDQNDPETKRYAQAMGLKLMSDIGKGATAAAMIPNVPVVAGAAAITGVASSVGTTVLSDDKRDAFGTELFKFGSQAAAEKALIHVLGYPPAVAKLVVGAIELLGGWDKFSEQYKDKVYGGGK